MPPFFWERRLPFSPARPISDELFLLFRARGIAVFNRPPPPSTSFPHSLFSSSTSPPLNQQVKRVRCESSGVLVPKDKAVKRFIVRNIVDASAVRDLQVRNKEF